jgi:leader peptidase (prepilin peptidase)/N-methyltransferase
LQYYFTVVSLLLGLVVGSFLNVVIYRLPRRESLVRPGSHCPGCGSSILWYDNIPVVSWLALRGRCRNCHKPISGRYPVVEAVTGIAFAAAYWRFGPSWALLVSWAFIAAMLATAFIDHDHMIIPDKIVLPGALLGLAACVAIRPGLWWQYLVACVGAAIFMFVLSIVWPDGMGPGDVKMALFMGAVLGVSVLVALFLAFLLGSAVGVYLLMVQKKSLRTTIAFGPYLAVGAVVAVFLGETVLSHYVGMYN